MFKHYFEQIEGIEIYPVIALIIFAAFFVLMLSWVLSVKKKEMAYMSELPLEDHSENHFQHKKNFYNET